MWVPAPPGVPFPNTSGRGAWQVRQTSLPNTPERDSEEDDAWERLRQLGLEPEEYFPLDEPQSEATQWP